MSNFKNQLINILKTEELEGERILSIGIQDNDKRYFKDIKCKTWMTMDVDMQYTPDILFDMNKPIHNEDGDLGIDYDFVGSFDIVLALNLWEYIYDPVTAHKNITDLLKGGGRYISNYPFVYGVHPPKGTDYLRYTEDAIEKYLVVAGLTLTEKKMIHGNELLKDFYMLDEMRVRKDYDHTIIGSFITAKK